MNAAAPVHCRAGGTVLSANGLGWGPKIGYRLSRRTDGTPIRGTIDRPENSPGRAMCRTCCDTAIANARSKP